MLGHPPRSVRSSSWRSRAPLAALFIPALLVQSVGEDGGRRSATGRRGRRLERIDRRSRARGRRLLTGVA